MKMCRRDSDDCLRHNLTKDNAPFNQQYVVDNYLKGEQNKK